MKESNAAASTPGSRIGSVIVRQAVKGLPPRSRPASSSVRSIPDSRAFTTSVANGIENAMWLMVIVWIPRSTRVRT